MGRPLKKDILGTDVLGTFVDTAAGIKVSFHNGTNLLADGIIIKQRGAKTFVVAQVGDIASNLTKTLNTFTCVLKNGVPSAAGEMRITGSTAGTLDTELVNCAKITKRVFTDFDGNRYTWKLENDSSADYIALTPVSVA